jgi:hypothetical protein
VTVVLSCEDTRRMCVNCVSSIDTAVVAVGGIAGLRAWLGANTRLLATPRRSRLFMLALALVALVVAGGALAGTG